MNGFRGEITTGQHDNISLAAAAAAATTLSDVVRSFRPLSQLAVIVITSLRQLRV